MHMMGMGMHEYEWSRRGRVLARQVLAGNVCLVIQLVILKIVMMPENRVSAVPCQPDLVQVVWEQQLTLVWHSQMGLSSLG